MHAAASRSIATLLLFVAVCGGSATEAAAQTNRHGPPRAFDDAVVPASTSGTASRPRTWPISFRRTETAAAGEQSNAGSTSSPAEKPLPLAPRKERSPNGANRPAAPTATRGLTTIFSSLALVLGLFFLVVWFTRRALPQRAIALPKEVVEVLGRAPLHGRQQMQLVRLGNKLVLLGISAAGAEALSEVTDADEVQRLIALCQESQPNSVSSTFRQILSQLGSEPAPRGFVGDSRRSDADVAVAPGRRRSRPSEVEDV